MKRDLETAKDVESDARPSFFVALVIRQSRYPETSFELARRSSEVKNNSYDGHKITSSSEQWCF